MKRKGKVLLMSVFTNVFLSIIKILGGIFGNSKTVLVDGVHSLSDFFADVFSFLGIKFSMKPADKEHPFGHGKLENIVSLFLGVIIIFIGVIMLRESFEEGLKKPKRFLSILVAVTIISKYFLSKYLYRKGVELDSPVLISSSKESKMDVLSGTFSLVIILLSLLSNKIYIFKYVDMVGSIVISIIIISTGFKIIREETSFLIGEEKTSDLVLEVVNNKIDNDIKLKNIKTIKYGNEFVCYIEIYLSSDLSFHDANKKRNELEDKILEEDIIKFVSIKMIPEK